MIADARAANFRQASLTTFRDVPFNAPFYARLGFEPMPLDTAPQALNAKFQAEVPDGIDPASRVLMVRRL